MMQLVAYLPIMIPVIDQIVAAIDSVNVLINTFQTMSTIHRMSGITRSLDIYN